MRIRLRVALRVLWSLLLYYDLYILYDDTKLNSCHEVCDH